MSKIAVFLLIFVTVCADAQTDARFNQALRLYAQKKYAPACVLLQKLVQAEPKRGLYWFNLGNCWYMQGRFREAERSFAEVASLGSPLTPAANLYRGRALQELGESADAAKILTALVRDRKTPPAIRLEASHELVITHSAPDNERALDLYRRGQFEQALAEIEKYPAADENSELLKALILIRLERPDAAQALLKTLEHTRVAATAHDLATKMTERIRDSYSKKQWFYLDGATGTDSDIRATNEAEAGEVLYFSLGAGAAFWSQGLWTASAAYNGHWDEVFQATDLRVYGHEGVLTLARSLGSDLILVAPYLADDSWAGRPARFGRGVRVHFRAGSESREFGISSQWEEDSALNSTDSYTSGTQFQARAYVGGLLYPVYLQGYLELSRVHVGDEVFSDGSVLPLSHIGWGPGVRAIWKMNSAWIADSGLSYQLRDYVEGRRDREWNASLKLNRLFGPQLTVYGLLVYTKDDSNIAAENFAGAGFQRLQFLLGATWDVF